MAVRNPVVAGQFYPETAAVLSESVKKYIDSACIIAAPQPVAAVIVPHAGYVYSGPIAGSAYARVLEEHPGRIILLGRSHRHAFQGISLLKSLDYASPLGSLPSDTEFIRNLSAAFEDVGETPHAQEHALEVQIPFIQIAFGIVPIVPLLLGGEADEEHIRLGEWLADHLDPEDLIIASTDLSHYLQEVDARAIDEKSVNIILDQDPDAFITALKKHEISMCGSSAVITAMACARKKGAIQCRMLDYRTSAEVSGDTWRVVGYTAVSMEYPDEGSY